MKGSVGWLTLLPEGKAGRFGEPLRQVLERHAGHVLVEERRGLVGRGGQASSRGHELLLLLLLLLLGGRLHGPPVGLVVVEVGLTAAKVQKREEFSQKMIFGSLGIPCTVNIGPDISKKKDQPVSPTT